MPIVGRGPKYLYGPSLQSEEQSANNTFCYNLGSHHIAIHESLCSKSAHSRLCMYVQRGTPAEIQDIEIYVWRTTNSVIRKVSYFRNTDPWPFFGGQGS